ncbi:MAG: hypothetical protein LUH82_06545, partial [Clostridiales bacterium]|nr:hypothetical protein [Clostridiales bacterium]
DEETATATTTETLLTYVWEVVKANERTLDKILAYYLDADTYNLLIPYYDNLLAMDGTDVVEMLIDVVAAIGGKENIEHADWSVITDGVSTTYTNQYSYDDEEIATLISTLTSLVETLLGSLLDVELDSLVAESLYTDSLMTTLASAIYSLFDNDTVVTVLALLGADVSQAGIAATLKSAGFSNVASLVEAAASFAEIDATEAWAWGIDGSEDKFAEALEAVLSPLNGVLEALLAGEDLDIVYNDETVLSITGHDGWSHAVEHLLEALGVEYSYEESDTALGNLIGAVLELLNTVLDSPVDTILNILPSAANFIEKGGVQLFVEELLYPVLNIADPLKAVLVGDAADSTSLFDVIFDILGLNDILCGLTGEDSSTVTYEWANIQDIIEPLLSALVSDLTLTINDEEVTLSLDLSAIDLEEIASYGYCETPSTTDNHETCGLTAADETVIYLIDVIWTVVTDNEDALCDLIESLINNDDTWSAIEEYIRNAFDLTTDEVIELILTLLGGFDDSEFTADWTFLYEDLEAATDLSGDYSTSDVTGVVDTISGLLSVVLAALDFDLGTLLTDYVYTDSLTDTIAGLIYGSVYSNSTVETVMSLLGIDVSAQAIYTSLTAAGYSDVAAAIIAEDAGVYSWKTDADYTALSWISEGNEAEDFVAALSAILSPLNSVLDFLLGSGTIEVLGISLTGADGWNNSIIPLLTALGVDTTDAEYDKDDVIGSILTPILSYAGELLADPVNGIIDILPSVANFIDKGGVQYLVYTLIHPIATLAPYAATILGLTVAETQTDEEEIEASFTALMEFVLDMLGVDLGWETLQNDLIPFANNYLGNLSINDEISFSVTIPELDWAMFGGAVADTATDETKKAGTEFVFANSDEETATATTTETLLTYVWNTVLVNAQTIAELLEYFIGEDTYETLAVYIEKLFALSADDVIGLLIDVLGGFDASDYVADWSFLYENYSEASVTYPDGVTSSDIDNLIAVLSSAIEGVLALLLDADLTELVAENLYTDDIVTTLASAIYSLFDNDTVVSVLAILGVDVSTDGIAATLKSAGYSKVASLISNADSFSDISTDSAWSWGVTDSASFAAAIEAILSPFNSVLDYLLGAGTINIADVLSLTGADGYNNAVKPLLEALGCTTVGYDSSNPLDSILTPLLNLVDEVLADPLGGVLDIVPSVANFIDQGGVQYFVESLLYPITSIADPLLFLISEDESVGLFDFVMELVASLLDVDLSWDNLQNEIIPLINTLLTDVEISGTTVSIAIPEIDWAALAGCGTATEGDYFISAEAADEVITVLRYVWNAVLVNEDAVDTLLESLIDSDTYETISPYLGIVFDLTADEIITVLVEMLGSFDDSDYTVDWSFLYENYATTAVTYPDGVTSTDITNLVSTISGLLEGVLDMLLDADLTELVAENVYTDDIITTLASTIYSLFDNETVVTVLGILGIDVSQDAVAKALKSAGYTKVASSISKASSYADADTSKWTWGVTDKESFAEALVAVLAPFNDVLGYFLNAGTIEILGIELTGANGYANAIKPLLDALGCDTLTESQYAAAANKDSSNLLLNIINPLLELVDEILADPVNGVVSILPSIANFMNQDGVQTAVEALLHPILNIVNPLFNLIIEKLGKDETTLFDFLFDLLGVNLTWDTLQDDIIPLVNDLLLQDITINDTVVTLRIPEIDWAVLAGCGKATTGDYFITAAAASTDLTVLRYIWRAVEENEGYLKVIISSLVGEDTYSTLSPYIMQLLDLTDDEFITKLVAIVNALDDSDYTVDWSFLYEDYTKKSVSYPDGVTSSDLKNLVSVLANAVNGVVEMLLDADLTELVAENVYTDDIITTLASAIYSLFDNDTVVTVLGILGIDVSKSAIVKSLKSAGYTKVASSIKKASSFAEADTSKWTWGVTDRESFVEALVAVLAPFNDVLGYFLNAGTIEIMGVEFTGANGYANAIKPLLDALGCDTLSESKYAAAAKKDSSNLLLNIINPLLDLVDEVLADPVNAVVDILPSVANFINQNGIQTAIEALLHPILNIADPILSIFTDDNVVDFILNLLGVSLDWDTIQNDIIPFVNKYLKNIEIGGVTVTLTIPNISWAKLAGCGKATDGDYFITGSTAKTAVTLLRYVWKAVETNEKAILKLVKGLAGSSTYKTLKPYLTALLDLTDDEVIKLLVDVVNAMDASDFKADWSFLYDNYKKTSVTYPDGVTSSDMNKLVSVLSSLVSGILELVLDADLTELVAENVYTDDIITTLASTIYSLFDNDTVVTVLGILGVDVSQSAVAKSLKSAGYTKVASSIKKASSFSAADTSKWSWGVTDKESFAEALVAILSPFNDVLGYFLNSGTIDISGIVTLTGANGYKNAIKPLLDALGCDTLSASKYAAAANKDSNNLLLNIINPLLDLVDEVLADPVNAVVDILPSVANFINQGGVQYFVECLLQPILGIANPVLAIFTDDSVFDFLFELLGVDFTWDNIQNEIIPFANTYLKNLDISGTTVTFKIPTITWGKLAGCGKATDGDYFITGSTAKTAVTLLRYIWKAVETNEKAIMKLVKGLAGSSTYKTLKPYLTKLFDLTDDEFIKVLVDVVNAMDASDYSESWSFLYKNYSTTSVTYPDGVTSSDLSEVVSILSEAVNNAIEIFLDGSLADLVGDTLYKDSIVTTLASTIFSLFDNSTVATVLGILGINVSQASVAKLLKSAGYTDVANSIKKASSFSAADTSKWSWGVTDRASFAEALVAVLSPFNGVLGYFLNAGSIDVLGITLTGANGYANAIKPLLDALGCDTLSASQYAAAANKDSNNLLLNIINPLLDLVDEILSSPVSKIAEILPSAANFIDKGGVQTAVEALLQPILGIVDPILTIFTDDGIFDFLFDLLGVDLSWGNIQNEVVGLLNSALLSDLTIGSTTLSLTLPEIDWGKLAGCGTLNGKKIEANTGKELLVLLRYVFKVLEQNKNTIFDLVGGKSSTIGTIINNVINVGADGLATIVVNILLKLETYEDSTWTFKSITEMVTTYTENMTEEDYANYLSQIDDLIIGLLKDLMGADSLLELVGNLVYTNDIINTLAELIYPNIEGLSDTLGFDINKIFAVLDIDISTTAFAKTVSDFSAASAAIAKCSSWADVDFDSLDWGVTTGDRTSFVNALTAILRPFFPVLQAILSGDDLVVLGSIEIAGGNGYNTAVIPLLEAFGVDADSLTSVAEYTANSGTDTVFTAIINPLLDKVEELLEAPIMTLCEMLPNVAYFLYNNHLSAVARNLLMPVTNILEEIDPIYSIDLEQYLSLLDDLDLASLVNSLIGSLEINGTALNIQITDIDLATLAGRGTLVSYTSARTYNSSRMTCKMIDADTTAVFISVFRYLIENLKANLDAITALLAMFELSDSVLDIVNTILEALVSMDVDSVIEMLLDLLFGSSDGSTAEEEEDAATSTPFNLGNYYWVYWLIFALVVILLFFLLLLIFKDDDDDEEEEDEAPNGDGGGSPPPAAGTAAENTDSAAGTEGANQ